MLEDLLERPLLALIFPQMITFLTSKMRALALYGTYPPCFLMFPKIHARTYG